MHRFRIHEMVFGFFLASVIWALGFVFQSSQPPQPPSQNQSASHTPNEASKGDDEKSLWKPNDPISLYTFVLAFFSGALVIISAIQIRFLIRGDRTARISAIAARRAANAARKSAGVAERALITANRPWVRPQVVSVDPIVITEQKLSFGITLQFFNSGKSPACNVDYFFDFVALDYPRLSIRQDDMCKVAEKFSAETDEKLQKHFTIFPNETGNTTFGFPIETSDVDTFNVRIGGPNDPNPIFWFAPTLIGCIAYRWDGSPKYHHTMFSYDFGEVSPDGAFMRIISGTKVIDAPNVSVKPGAIARNTAD